MLKSILVATATTIGSGGLFAAVALDKTGDALISAGKLTKRGATKVARGAEKAQAELLKKAEAVEKAQLAQARARRRARCQELAEKLQLETMELAALGVPA